MRWVIGASAGVVLALTYGPAWFLAGFLWPVVLTLVDISSAEEVRRA
jgi:hypothetical protein